MITRTIPDSWMLARISDIALKASQRKPAPNECFTYVDIGSIDRKRKQISGPQVIDGDEAPSRARKVIEAGDVLVSLTRPNLNAVALIGPEYHDQIASTGFEVIKPVLVESRYIFALVQSKEFIDVISGAVQGALYPAAKSADVQSFQFALPPLAEQKVIADKLDTLLAQVETAKARLERIPQILKRFRQSVLAAAVSGRLTEEWRASNKAVVSGHDLHKQIKEAHAAEGGHARGNASKPTVEAHDLSSDDLPECWDVAEMRDICVPGRPITYGILKPGPELEEGVSYIRVADFPGNKLNMANIKKTSIEIDQQFKRARLSAGDLLLSIRGSVGRLIKIPASLEGANITQDTARLSISPLVSTDFVYWALLAESTQRRMKNATRGVAVRGINIGDVRALQVPLPPFVEQTEIVHRVDQLFTHADRIEQQVQAALERVNHLTQSILAKAFRGELTEQWRKDNPELISGENSAAALLERIKAERAAMQPAKKGRRTKMSS